MWVVHARLPAEEVALLVKAIDAVVEPVLAKRRQACLDTRAAV